MRADMIDIEHWSSTLIAVVIDPGDHGSIHFRHLFVSALDHTAGDLYRRKRFELHMLGVRILAFDSLPGNELLLSSSLP